MLDYRNKKNKLKKLYVRNVERIAIRKISQTINTNIYIQQPKISIWNENWIYIRKSIYQIPKGATMAKNMDIWKMLAKKNQYV